MAKAKKRKVLKVKKKKWVEIVAPKIFNEISLGRTYVVQKEDTLNKFITVNLMNITRDPKKQSINVTFRINNTLGEKVKTEIVKYAMQPTAVRRFVRRQKDKVDDSFIVKSKDNIKIRVKPILVTIAPASKPVQSSLRAKARQVIANEIAKLSYEKFIEEVIQRAFQKKVKSQIKKIFPLAICEIRVAEIVKTTKLAKEETKPAKEEPKVEEKKEEVKEKTKPIEDKPKEEVKEKTKPKEEVKEEPKIEEKKEEPKVEEKKEEKKEEVKEETKETAEATS